MSDANPMIASSGLSEIDERLLDFEASWWSATDNKEAAILERFGLSSPRYYQQLNALIDRPEALAYAPMLVKRLRRQRQRRQEKRTARHLGAHSVI